MITLNSRLIRRLPILGILLCPGTPRGNGVEREGQAPAGRSAVGTAGASWAGCGLGGSAGTATHAPRPIEKDRHCDDPTRAGARGPRAARRGKTSGPEWRGAMENVRPCASRRQLPVGCPLRIALLAAALAVNAHLLDR